VGERDLKDSTTNSRIRDDSPSLTNGGNSWEKEGEGRVMDRKKCPQRKDVSGTPRGHLGKRPKDHGLLVPRGERMNGGILRTANKNVLEDQRRTLEQDKEN